MSHKRFELSSQQQIQLEKLLLSFDEDWNSDAIQPFLSDLQNESLIYRQAAIIELLKIDLERHWSAGASPTLDDYPEAMALAGWETEVPAELILAEFVARYESGRKAKASEYRKRYPEQFDDFLKLFEREKSRRSLLGNQGPNLKTESFDEYSINPSNRTQTQSPGDPQSLPETFGRYKIQKRLGAGAMGAVYLAHDSKLDRQVALKTPTFGGNKNEQLVQRFYREAQAAANLRNPNICPVYDVGEIEGRHYITMAFIQGRPLSDYVGQTLDQKTVALIIRKLAKALAEAHGEGVIHRDLKPANIMVDQKRRPLVMDFGLAHRKDEGESRMTQSGTIMGTPAYMSPEQVKGDIDEVDAQADIYSLGIILYELLTGQVPFDGSIAAVIGQVLTEAPLPPIELRKDLDPMLQAICLKMIAKEKSDRYPTMQAVSKDLRDYLKGSSTQVVDLPTIETPVLPHLGTRTFRSTKKKTKRSKSSFWKTRAGRDTKWVFLGLSLITLIAVFIFEPWNFLDLKQISFSVQETPQEKKAADQGESLGDFDREDDPSFSKDKSQPADQTNDDPKKESPDLSDQKNDDAEQEIEEGTQRSQEVQQNDVAISNPSGDVDPSSDQMESNLNSSPPPLAIAPFDAEKAKEYQSSWAAYLGIEIESVNSIGMTFRLIPPGRCAIGPQNTDSPNMVDVETFLLGKYEVTQSQYHRLMGPDPSGQKNSNYPMSGVSWDNAVQFCEKLSALPEEKAAGRVYELPSENQWEYACRAGTTSEYSFGEGTQDLADYAVFGNGPEEVGTKLPNPWGIHNMHGNVLEWCQNDYENTKSKAARGGGYHDARFRGSSSRHYDPKSTKKLYLGFRVICRVNRAYSENEVAVDKTADNKRRSNPNLDSAHSTSDTGKKIPHQKQPFIDLIENVDPQKHKKRGGWILNGAGEIEITNAGGACILNVPCAISDSYEFKIEYTRRGKTAGLILPIGKEMCVLFFVNDLCLEFYDKAQAKPWYVGAGPVDNEDGVRHKVRGEVRSTDNGGEIKIWLNDKFAFEWSGPREKIKMFSEYELSKSFHLGLLAFNNTSVVFHQFQYRSLQALKSNASLEERDHDKLSNSTKDSALSKQRQRRDSPKTIYKKNVGKLPLVSWEEAADYSNQRIVVYGTIVSVRSSSTGKTQYLEFVEGDRSRFKIAIRQAELPISESELSLKFLNKAVQIQGVVQRFMNNPEIVLKDLNQIEVVEQ